MVRKWTIQEALSGIPEHIWTSEPDVADVLCALIKAHKAEVVVESGVWYGYTSCRMIDSLPEKGMYIGLDVEDHRPYSVKAYFEGLTKNKVKNAELILGSSLGTMATLKPRSADLIFIDSVHELGYLREEFKLAERVIKQNGLICLHDSIHVEGVWHMVEYVKKFGWFEVVNLNTSEGRGLAIIKCLHA